MSTEYGIFSDEGLLEGGFITVEAAQKVATTTYAEDGVHVAEVCPEHEEQEREHCEECSADEPEPEVAARREFLRLHGTDEDT